MPLGIEKSRFVSNITLESNSYQLTSQKEEWVHSNHSICCASSWHNEIWAHYCMSWLNYCGIPNFDRQYETMSTISNDLAVEIEHSIPPTGASAKSSCSQSSLIESNLQKPCVTHVPIRSGMYIGNIAGRRQKERIVGSSHLILRIAY